MHQSRFNIPTYFGVAYADEIERGEKAEFGEPYNLVHIYEENGLRILLGDCEIGGDDVPDIKIERRPNGWAIFLHPSGATDPSGYIYFVDDGRSFLVKDDLVHEPIRIVHHENEVSDVDKVP